jgi:hypothetical protein
MSEEKYAKDLEEYQAALNGGLFIVDRVYEESDPHPYCITSSHVVHASDHFSGVLGNEAIKSLEKSRGRGCCGMYVGPDGKFSNGKRYGYERCTLRYDEHVTKKILFVKLTRDLSNIEAASELFKIKELLGQKGYEGVGFPNLNKEYKIAPPDEVTA